VDILDAVDSVGEMIMTLTVINSKVGKTLIGLDKDSMAQDPRIVTAGEGDFNWDC
jgi:hypothetical protein